jgi:S-DNA-T family DNA segregation ATPase FtsK/SpoIIIE
MNKLARKEKVHEEEEYEPVPMPVPEEEEEEEEIKPVAKKEKKIEEEEVFIPTKPRKSNSSYTPPPLELLERDKGKPNVGDIKANANIIKRTLQNFGILVEMDEITIGPSVTRYALKPAEGVKLSRIVGLQSDLALALAAHPIRIEAPIPGKSLVGIEIPNRVKSTVGLATLLSDPAFHSPNPLMVALGRGISGKAHFGNLAKMPHALIAGTTGSGKSVTIHSIITSLLYRNGPEELRFIMVDPKRVELTLYNKIPHLLTPVITDSKKAILALKWAAKEMDRRYDILQSESARDITSYHALIQNDTKNKEGEDRDKMPYIVVIIDELADIMQAYPRELEAAIVRLAQMSRAVGIHLILSTQRPEVNVITGLIKANVPARIALKVASQIDSRTILDQGGAEKLLGQGDMLCLAGESQPERLQSAFISEGEVKKVVSYLADAYKDEVPDEIINLSGNISADKSIFESSLEDGDSDDEMYEAAREIVIETGKASTSFLQRKLKLGYARAARLMDILEERGVVGPSDGARGREVLERSPDAVMKEEFGGLPEEE